ncbi:MAG: hypothetical protein E7F58_11340 [Clostridium saudiense]|uniref:hypothetical protein n=1 Tax=Clostridium saudiense TaxID=1414720 RepID=UPI0022046DE8|nr:hypothetical protein [Clostridium saudiense]MDU3522234.1 hypothetical protein [Clostridium saudiense]UVX78380.1 MAG: hypothetical protein [Bacteriophage sp.]
MEEYKRIAAETLNDTETTLYTSSKGAILKTILMHNTTSSEVDVTLSLDSVIFIFKIATKETAIVDKSILTNSIKAKGNGVNIHISGIQL